MPPVVCRDISNRAVYTIIISTNVNKDKLVLTYHHSFIGQRCTATSCDLEVIIIRRTYKNSVLILVLNFILIWIHIVTMCFIF
jgi:hypothetical protein